MCGDSITRTTLALFLSLGFFVSSGRSQSFQTLSAEAKRFVKLHAPIIALTHVRVIDGTGAPAREEQTLVIADGKIQSMGPFAEAKLPDGAEVMDLRGRTIFPGFVGMHEHLFYTAFIDFSGTPTLQQMNFSFPRLYLAAGVTTIRTAGSIAPYMDLNVKRLVESGKVPGPKMHVTGPYLGRGGGLVEWPEVRGADNMRKAVNYWADQGATSVKTYIDITRDELRAVIEASHNRGLKVTGHLCSITFPEAIELGIDNIEHGFATNTDWIPRKKPDVCPPNGFNGLANRNVTDEPARALIRLLVQRHVAITSTLPVFEQYVAKRPPLEQRVLDTMCPQSRTSCLAQRARVTANNSFATSFKKEMQFELAFVRAGGLLLAGSDPTGAGSVVAGFGMQREVELLVEAGFTPVQAIQIATANGAEFLGESARIGTLAPGKKADLVVVQGDPSAKIEDIRKVETVFKDGIGYDSAKLMESVHGMVGFR
jgi:imidazolonepropionase-like amidohydrolase